MERIKFLSYGKIKMIKSKKVKVINYEELYCDECGAKMEASCEVLCSYPPQYKYYCIRCNNTYTSREIYPRLVYDWEEEE